MHFAPSDKSQSFSRVLNYGSLPDIELGTGIAVITDDLDEVMRFRSKLISKACIVVHSEGTDPSEIARLIDLPMVGSFVWDDSYEADMESGFLDLGLHVASGFVTYDDTIENMMTLF